MANTHTGESGHDFERRGLTLARALHDPFGTQGAITYKGRERDGLFDRNDTIHAYEFTIDTKKLKATKDGEKLVELLAGLGREAEHRFKGRIGWFVTLNEPTADQRSEISRISKASGETVHAISISTMHQRICNSELYIQARNNAPFGSIEFGEAHKTNPPNVAVNLIANSGDSFNATRMAEKLAEGNRAVLEGNYGVGKSHTLRELYTILRKMHFKSGKLTPFPVHINLRDCAGLRSPAEILRRHAEEIGFENADSLISAWRAGSTVLLLDGFDEIVPRRWFGGAADLKTVRWDALNPVRRLVTETPAGSGIIVAGRSHYFSGKAEMVEALGFRAYELYSVPDFNEDQLNDFLEQAGAKWEVPDWVPMRPLLLGYLVQFAESQTSAITASTTRASGWRHFLDAISQREARMFEAVRPQIIRDIVCRVATLARSRTDSTGPIDMDMLQSAFIGINGLQPDEEGIQLLLRLPGLASADSNDDIDSRVFVDRDLADAAYALDLSKYAINPYDDSHPLNSTASWANASSGLGIEIAVDELETQQIDGRNILPALARRNQMERHDAVMADLIAIGTHFDWDRSRHTQPLLVSGVHFEELNPDSHPIMGSTTYSDCIIERIDIGGLEEKGPAPHFQNTMIEFFDGSPSMPEWLRGNFTNCEINEYVTSSSTTAGILSLNLDRDSKIALTILKKIYSQRGSARKEGALRRGLDPAERPFVPQVVDALESQGWILKSSSGNNVVYTGVKERRRDALRALEHPTEFKL